MISKGRREEIEVAAQEYLGVLPDKVAVGFHTVGISADDFSYEQLTDLLTKLKVQGEVRIANNPNCTFILWTEGL